MSSGPNARSVLAPVAADHDPGGPVLRREVGQRPDGVALHLVARREREEVEGPLVAVDRLRCLPGADGDGLGQVQLDVGGVPEERARRPQRQRVHDQLAAAGRAGDERARAPRPVAAEVVGPGRGGVEVGAELGLDPLQERRRRHPVDDDCAVTPDCRRHLVRAGVAAEVGDGHAPSSPTDVGAATSQVVGATPPSAALAGRRTGEALRTGEDGAQRVEQGSVTDEGRRVVGVEPTVDQPAEGLSGQLEVGRLPGRRRASAPRPQPRGAA